MVAIDSRRGPRRFSFSIRSSPPRRWRFAPVCGCGLDAIRDGGTIDPSTVAAGARSEEPITGATAPGAEEPITGVTVADRAVEDGAVPAGFAEYEAAVDDLERLLDELGAAIDPETRKAIDENLAIIDHAIQQTRRALEEDPDDGYLNTHLASTMQRKIDVLQGATRLARAST